MLLAIIAFSVIRYRQAPARKERASRFYGSHTKPAWLVLFMIFNVMWTLLLYRGAQINNGVFPYAQGAFASEAVARLLAPLGATANDVLETAGLLASLGIVLGFLVRNEPIDAWLIVGTALVIAGVALVNGRWGRRRLFAPAPQPTKPA